MKNLIKLEEKADRLAESYINGNISYVRNKIKNNGILAIAVYGRILDTQDNNNAILFFNCMVKACI